MNELLKYTDQVTSVDCNEDDSNDTPMPMPSIDDSPHLLISKVRKYYLDHIIKLLSVNYENNQRHLGKNIYLPTGIWRCAKYIELFAAQSCMVTDLYRQNILKEIAKLKSDTKNGRLNKKLFECLQGRPKNERVVQTDPNYKCRACDKSIPMNKKRKWSEASFDNEGASPKIAGQDNHTNGSEQQRNLHPVGTLQPDTNCQLNYENKLSNEDQNTSVPNKVPSGSRLSVESEDGGEDSIMLQLAHLFRADSNEPETELFEGTICDDFDPIFDVKPKPTSTEQKNEISSTTVDQQAAKIKSLDERLALIESRSVLNIPQNQNTKSESPKKIRKHTTSKWICEAYHQKFYLFEKLDELRDMNRKKYTRIKAKYIDLFGVDDEEDQILSPLEETADFINSCKERVAPWLIKILTPYYVKGRIRGKPLFKSVAKHLLRLIYQCSKYPSEYEVICFVTDFLKSHKMIRCEADFKQFRIDNI